MEFLVKKAKQDHQAHKELRGHKETRDQKVQLDKLEVKDRVECLVREEYLGLKDSQADQETGELLAFLGILVSLVPQELLVK